MNREKFISYIAQPANLLSNPDTLMLNEIVQNFPFFQTAHILLYAAQNITEGIFTTNNLRNCAVYAGDRAKLYKIIKEKSLIDKDPFASGEIEADQLDQNIYEKNEGGNLREEKHHSEKRMKDLEIIEKFIETNPSVQKPKSEFYSPPLMAARSVEDHYEFATETLAKIYIRSQNYDKAIKIYQRLFKRYILRVP